MQGTNPIRQQELNDDGKLWVHSIFPTLQGEGPLVGLPSIFVRLGGCNLACHFCDTQFEEGSEWMTVAEIMEKVWSHYHGNTAPFPLLVLTGGEPMRQNIVPLIQEYLRASKEAAVQIETAGTLWVDGLDMHAFTYRYPRQGRVTVVCSPKTPKLNEKIVPYIHAWKYIIRASELHPSWNLPGMSTQKLNILSTIARPPEYVRRTDIYMQPCDEGENAGATLANTRTAVALCQRYGYRMSLQTHKILGLD